MLPFDKFNYELQRVRIRQQSAAVNRIDVIAASLGVQRRGWESMSTPFVAMILLLGFGR